MAALAAETNEFQDTTGFVVESAAGDTGWVEDVWLGDADEPRALAVQTVDGRRALLLTENVLAVDREHRWVVISPDQELLELDAPRLAGDGRTGLRLAASWGTTGAVLPAPARPHWRFPRVPHHARTERRPRQGPPAVTQVGRGRALWQTVLILYGTLALIAAGLIALAFAVARLVTGAAY